MTCSRSSTPVFSINKTDSHDITEILLKVALTTITLTLTQTRTTTSNITKNKQKLLQIYFKTTLLTWQVITFKPVWRFFNCYICYILCHLVYCKQLLTNANWRTHLTYIHTHLIIYGSKLGVHSHPFWRPFKKESNLLYL